MKKFFTLITAVLLATSMRGETYTLGWGSATGAAGTYTNFTATSGSVAGVVSFTTAKNSSSTAPAYNSNNKELRLYYHSGGNGGSITLTPASGVTITGFVLTATAENTPTVGYSVNGGSATNITHSNNTYTVTGISATSSLVIQNVNKTNTKLFIQTIQITYSADVSDCANPLFLPESQTFYGNSISVELSCTTTGATIHYTTDGSTPTKESTVYSSALSITETTTVKAIAVKDGLGDSEVVSATYTKGANVEGYDIDFETNTLIAYVNWDFTNIAIASTAITAHGGTYYGNTDGKASASITSKAAIALPGELTFYTSKESGNTTASSWKVQVSADKEEWTDVASFDATTGSKGEWTERIAELDDYTNVYVRISYGGSTAIRAIDDITLTEAVPTSVAKPTFSVEAGTYTEAKNVELACETEGATIYYTINGDDPTEESTEYTAAIALSNAGIYTIKAIAIKGEDKSKVVSSTYIINLPFASLSELVSAFGATEVDDVTVTLTNIEITDFSNNRKGVYVNVKAANDKNIQLYNESTEAPEEWKSEGKLSGTISGNWVHYTQYSNDQWEIIVSSWDDLTYKETATAIDNTSVDSKAVKMIVNGQLVIEKNGVRYNAMGQIVR